MRFLDLDGEPLEIKIKNRTLYKEVTNKSKLHKSAYKLIKETFPIFDVYEEVGLPIADKLLYIDLFIPELNMVVEVHGKQHYEFTPRFHKSKTHFLISKNNDNLKKEWCKINNLKYVELPYNEKLEQWRDRIVN